VKVALVHLGRAKARGEVRRVESWRTMFEAAGAQVVDVPVGTGRMPHLAKLSGLVPGTAVPESLTWSTGAVIGRLEALGPDLVVVISVRAFDNRLADGPWTTILDFVDSLARSYSDRGEVMKGARKLGFTALARMHGRAERTLARRGLHTVAAGWADAQRLGAEWVPIITGPGESSRRTAAADHDVLFMGTLRYPPNIDGLERLGRLWPRVLAARPETTALVAGADPPARVVELAHHHGWDLVANFASLADVAARARVAVAPLARTAGIQIKVLDAAALGVPQVVTTAALGGLAPGFPIEPVDDDDAFAAEIVRLLEDPESAAASAASLRAHVEAEYGVGRWARWAADQLPGS
jgi:glycosyltransferase involved in cell wall biosynthesis